MHCRFRHGAALSGLVLAALALSPSFGDCQSGPDGARPFYSGTQLLEINLGYGQWLDERASRGSYGFGASYNYFLSPVTSAGLEVAADQLGQVTTPGNGSFDFQSVSLTAQLALNAHTGIFAPYLAAGTGTYLLHTRVEGEEQLSPRWGFMGRAGVRMVGWSPALGLEARHSWILLGRDVDVGVASGETYTRTFSLRASLAWIF